MAIGLAVSFCIIIYITHELSYDKHLENYDNIYRVDSHSSDLQWRQALTNIPLAAEAKRTIPGIDNFVRLRKDSKAKLILDRKEFKFDNTYFADPSVFDIFSFDFLRGNHTAALSDPYSAVITESTARKCFGNTDIIGQSLNVQIDSNSATVIITGVIKDEKMPATLVPDAILPLELIYKLDKFYKPDDWFALQKVHTYLYLSENADIKKIEKELKIINDDKNKDNEGFVINLEFSVIPLRDTYFTNEGYAVIPWLPIINFENIFIYSGIAILILLLACINFIVLTSARYSVRNTEIGVRKVIGAKRTDIARQLITESVLTSILALPLALIFIELIFSFFEEIINRQIHSSFYTSIYFLAGFIVINFLVGIISGSYNALTYSRMNTINIFKNKFNTFGSRLNLKKVLISFQMVVFISLIISTLVLNSQLKLTHEKDLGFDTENFLEINCWTIDGKQEVFKNSLSSYPGIIDIVFTSSTFPYTRGNRYVVSSADNPERNGTFGCPLVGYDYPKLINMLLIKGEFPTSGNYKRKAILNETAVKELGYDDPVGKYILLFNSIRLEVIGVVKDFNLNSLRDAIRPVAIRIGNFDSRLVIKYDPAKVEETMKFINNAWKEVTSEPIYITFLDEKINQMYNEEYRFSKAINFFTIIAIIIAAMGLFGVVLFSTQQRTKEIGIRKILGASVPGIVHLVIYEFLVILIAAFIIAAPLSYYFMNLWLQDFAYRIDIGFGIYMLAATLAFLIIVSTVIIQAVRAARANPVESLKYE